MAWTMTKTHCQKCGEVGKRRHEVGTPLEDCRCGGKLVEATDTHARDHMARREAALRRN